MHQLIKTIVEEFYALATTDVLIGYHFRKIREKDGEHPLKPPLDAFSKHLPRIINFWEVQLLGEKIKGESFDLIKLHKELGILPGELGRWLMLFRQVLQSKDQDMPIIQQWEQKLAHFEIIFKKHLFS